MTPQTKPRTYADDRGWSDRYIPAIKRILGGYLLTETPDLIDMTEAADLMLATVGSKRIACRIRANHYLHKYPTDITLRSKRPSGVPTELDKILEGCADWMFYGFAGKDGERLSAYYLLDLDIFRRTVEWDVMGDGWTSRKVNKDGTEFLVINLATFPDPRIIIGSDAGPGIPIVRKTS